MRLVDLLNNVDIQITDADILNAKFTNLDLVQVYKTDEDETIYVDSAEFEGNDGDMIAVVGMNDDYPEAKEAVVFPAGSWIVKSLKSFTSKEKLTIDCFNGDKYSIDVTDPVNGSGQVDLADSANASLGLSVDESVTATDQERDISFDLALSYTLTADGLAALKSQNPAILVYDLSSILNNNDLVNSLSDSSGNVTVGRTTIGEYEIINNVAYITVTNRTWLDSRTSLKGTLEITVQIDEEKLGEKDETEIKLPLASNGITVKFKKKVEEGWKSVNAVQNEDGSYTLSYSAQVQVNTDLDSLVFNDILSANQTLDSSSVKINGTSVSPTPTSTGFTINIAQVLGTSGVQAGNYNVTYTTNVSKATLDALQENAKEKVTNKATWNVDGTKNVPGGETEKEFEKPKPPTPDLKKEANPANGSTVNPDGTITYTITYGKAGEDVGGVTVHDWMTDMQVLQGSVSVSGGVTATLDGSNGLTYQDDHKYSHGTTDVFNYTIPEGTTGPVIFTYTTKVISQETAKANGIYDTVDVSNFVNENKSYKQPQTTHKVPFEKEPQVNVSKTASANMVTDGKWQPGAVITYTITIGDSTTLLDGLRVTDKMTDLQKLNVSSVSMTVRGSAATIPEGGVKYYDDGKFTTGDVEVLDFVFPTGTGNGPAVITYTTTVATAAEAGQAQVYGDQSVNNTATGGKGSDGTQGTVEFPEMPLDKDVQQSSTSVDGQGVNSGSTVHYVITFGNANTLMDYVMIYDEFTDLQKLASDVTVKIRDQAAFTMPDAAHNYDSTGVIWQHYDDGAYSTNMTPVFRYTLPEGTGVGPIVVEYDAQIISEAEAMDAGVEGIQNVKNKVTVGQKSDETTVTVEYPTTPTHNPTINKEFDHWDVENHMVYWNIVVDKTADSAFPLTDVYALENTITIHDGVVPKWITYHGNESGKFKFKQAVVKTQSGIVLEPGKDYQIVESINAYNLDQQGNYSGFYFPTVAEPIVITLAFVSPYDITEGYTATNIAILNGGTESSATETYHNSKIEVSKDGAYDEENKIVTWTITLNDGQKVFEGETEPYEVWFEDILPEGHTLLNYSNHEESNPSIKVEYYGKNYWSNQKLYEYPVTVQIVTATGQQGHNSGPARDTISGRKLSQYPARKTAFLYNGRTSFRKRNPL